MVYTASELRELLADAGLATLGLYGSPEGAPFRVASPHVLFVAEKTA